MKKQYFVLLFLILLCIMGFRLNGRFEQSLAELTQTEKPFLYTPVIDPGHGGIDGGASGVSGSRECDINLDIGLKTELLMRFLGLNPIMTRDSDISIHTSDAKTIAQKKRSDLSQRVRLANLSDDRVLISIHQNKFEQSKYYGAQVFYNGNNKNFAEIMQKSLRETLDPANDRQAKSSGGNVYLLEHTRRPAVLIECGFLSNHTEEALLQNNIYQLKISMAICGGFLEWAKSESMQNNVQN